ncbi:MAG: alpha/beta hydrolase [Chloroflexi bacterium]|nr:alpha/beta hydrolase [Chloroflexota bacterium]
MMPITHRIPGLLLTDHEFRVPIDYAQPDGAQLAVFAREVVAPDKAHANLPWLVFFQGGPGYGSPRPNDASTPGWIGRAVKDYRVLLLDQRGTGRSRPIGYQSLARFRSPQEQADYLKLFRADNIVRDAEWIRREMQIDRWSVLGQSFGGFCVTTYLSLAPDGLCEAFITGGLPPIDHHTDDVYRATYPRVREKNRLYFERYPEDAQRLRDIVDYLMKNDVRLPCGDPLTPRRVQQLGMSFGVSDGFESVHYLLEEAFIDGAYGQEISYTFLRGVENAQHFDTNPIYSLLHEPCYAEGTICNWSADRVRAEFPEFAITPDRPVLFTGEMVYPWMFDDYRALQPLQEAAHILAQFDGWPHLYDKEVLQQNTVPVAAALYYNDMYVDRLLSEEAASFIKGIRVWATSEYEHNGLRADGEKVLGRLFGLVHGEI